MILRREARSVGAGAGVAASRDPAASVILTVSGGVERLGYWELAVSDRSTDWSSILWCCYHERGISNSERLALSKMP